MVKAAAQARTPYIMACGKLMSHAERSLVICSSTLPLAGWRVTSNDSTFAIWNPADAVEAGSPAEASGLAADAACSTECTCCQEPKNESSEPIICCSTGRIAVGTSADSAL